MHWLPGARTCPVRPAWNWIPGDEESSPTCFGYAPSTVRAFGVGIARGSRVGRPDQFAAAGTYFAPSASRHFAVTAHRSLPSWSNPLRQSARRRRLWQAGKCCPCDLAGTPELFWLIVGPYRDFLDQPRQGGWRHPRRLLLTGIFFTTPDPCLQSASLNSRVFGFLRILGSYHSIVRNQAAGTAAFPLPYADTVNRDGTAAPISSK